MTNSTKNIEDSNVIVTNEELMKLVIELETRQKEFAVRLARLEALVQVSVPLSQLPL